MYSTQMGHNHAINFELLHHMTIPWQFTTILNEILLPEIYEQA